MADKKPLEEQEAPVVEETKVEETPESTTVETPEVETESAESEPEQSEEQAEEEEPSETPPISRRKAARLEKLESLVDRLKGEEKQPAFNQPKGMDYRKTLDADEETVNQLEADRKSYAEASFQQGVEQARTLQFHTRLEIDSPRVESKYPLFDTGSSEFKPEAANAINRWYLAAVGYDAENDTVKNPNVRYMDFVDGIMELADSMAGVKVEKTQQNIAKQAAQTGLRPDGSSAKMNLNKPPGQMTDEELKAVIAQAIPKG